MNVKAELTQRKSQKGNDYVCIVLHLTPTYEKVVFLDKAEEELLRAFANNNSNVNK